MIRIYDKNNESDNDNYIDSDKDNDNNSYSESGSVYMGIFFPLDVLFQKLVERLEPDSNPRLLVSSHA